MTKNKIVRFSTFLSHDIIERKIYFFRGKKVMFDRDLAALYDVETRLLNQAVLRNLDRFPSDFMFQLNDSEFKNLISQFGTSSWGGTRKHPRVFTEYGILMLSSVLNSKRALRVNIEIMRTFSKIREFVMSHKDLQRKIRDLERKYDSQFKVVFEAIREILEPSAGPLKKPIGFHAKYV